MPWCRAIIQVETRSLCVHGAQCPLGNGPPPSLCSRRPHRTFVPLSPSCIIVQGNHSSRDALVVRSWFSMPSLASGRRRRCALAVHIGRLHRSGHRAGRSFKSRCALCAHVARCPSLASQAAAAAVCLLRPHRTFTPLSPSCRAIVQVETCSLRSRCSMPSF